MLVNGELIISGEDADPLTAGDIWLYATEGVTIYFDDVQVIELESERTGTADEAA